MNKTEKLELMKRWQVAIDASDAALNKLADVVGSYDGPLGHSLFALQSEYTRAVSMLIGDTDWLEWYSLENDMGRKGLKACGSESQKMRKIETLKQLLAVIEAD